MKSIEQVLTEMLKESTGKNAMDSGDAYGRHWEDNQKNGIKTGYQVCDFYIDDNDKTCELNPTIPIFDVLKNTLMYTEECVYLEGLLPSDIYSSDTLYWISEQIENNKVKDFQAYENMNKVCNTYEEESFASQDYAYIIFEHEDDLYIAISMHNGCDIRGGYTNVHIFEIGEISEFKTAHFDVIIECVNDDGQFTMCDGYQMYGNHIYYSLHEQADVDESYIYEHTYVDDDEQLRCKECDGILMCSAVQY